MQNGYALFVFFCQYSAKGKKIFACFRIRADGLRLHAFRTFYVRVYKEIHFFADGIYGKCKT